MENLEEYYQKMKVKDGPVDAVVFDIGNVLATYEEANFFRLRGFNEEMTQKLANATLRDPKWLEVDQSVRPFKEYVAYFMEKNPDLAKDIEYAMSDVSNICSRRETTIPWIEEIHEKGRKVYYLSNYGKELFEQSCKNLDCLDYTDGGVISYQVKMVKPHHDIYEYTIKKFHLNPNRSVFIDDNLKNVIGASECGFQTILCKSQPQAIKDLDQLLAIER